MKKSLLLTLALVASIGLLFTSCAKESNTITPKKEEVKTISIDVTNSGVFNHFSFEKGEIVPETDNSWDIAIRHKYIRTNGGAAIKSNSLKMEEVTTLPVGEFTKDTMSKLPKTDNNGKLIMPPTLIDASLNTVLGGWITSSGRPPHTYDNSVFVLRNAKGKYAKIQFISLEGEKVTFKYVYPFTPSK